MFTCKKYFDVRLDHSNLPFAKMLTIYNQLHFLLQVSVNIHILTKKRTIVKLFLFVRVHVNGQLRVYFNSLFFNIMNSAM